MMRTVGDHPHCERLRALIVLLWRAGLRISEVLALQESDLDGGRGAVLVRRGKGDLDALVSLAAAEEAIEILVGLPRSLSGREGPAAATARQFAAGLAARPDPRRRGRSRCRPLHAPHRQSTRS